MRLAPRSVLLLSAALACGSDPVTPAPQHPLAGVYDITSSLDTLRPRIGCPTGGGVCYGAVATNGYAAFSGSLTIADAMASSSFPRPLQLQALGVVQPCAPSAATDGCGAAAVPFSVTFRGGLDVADSTTAAPLELVLVTPDGSSSPTGQIMILDLRSELVGDSLSGTIAVAINGGSRYEGEFVAHKRH